MSIRKMERIHTADDPIFIGYLKSRLEAEGIPCDVRNESLLGGAGELPPNECWPELWVLRETDVAAARAIVKKALEAPPPDAAPWECHHCGEACEPQFNACWRCGALRR
ncbi:MAG: DUF2007 domain-containing protein [Gammaproteobacteria bacterium]|nr:DUF2007 domain-containing protein [Gammaproteobacteria bacterium]HJP34966.1 DUF2007 domain-containing protein [Gammaproteobacteria bacterium]